MELVSCPFIKTHKVLPHRLASHIIKCKQSYQGPLLEQCKYNATHYVPEGQLNSHYETCRSYYEFSRENYEKYYNTFTSSSLQPENQT